MIVFSSRKGNMSSGLIVLALMLERVPSCITESSYYLDRFIYLLLGSIFPSFEQGLIATGFVDLFWGLNVGSHGVYLAQGLTQRKTERVTVAISHTLIISILQTFPWSWMDLGCFVFKAIGLSHGLQERCRMPCTVAASVTGMAVRRKCIGALIST